jgi:hydroxymethylpyrimidine pyrophosphatase-like HAD family hydrolase
VRLPACSTAEAASDCLAFGDGMNDFAMLRLAGQAVVIGNAAARVKAALADLETIGHHDDHGVARYSHRLYQLDGAIATW